MTSATLKIRKIGNSEGCIFPKEMLARLGLKADDALYASVVGDKIVLSPFDPAFAEQLEIAEALQNEYRDALRELAK